VPKSPFRYAVYYVPDLYTEFYRLGSSLLGYSLREGKDVPYPVLMSERISGEFTRRASTYGFHSTVIAPFRTERGYETVEAAVRHALSGHRPFAFSKLELTLLSGFPALSTRTLMEPFLALEKSLLMSLHPLFLPPDPESLAKRGTLKPSQIDLFWKWGYPFVLNEHRFHLTLGDRGSTDAYIESLKGYFPPEMLEGVVIDKVVLCSQGEPEGRFTVIKDFPLG
jgi:hypothetical protein